MKLQQKSHKSAHRVSEAGVGFQIFPQLRQEIWEFVSKGLVIGGGNFPGQGLNLVNQLLLLETTLMYEMTVQHPSVALATTAA